MVYSTSDLQGRQRELLDLADSGAIFINRRHVLYRLEKVMDYRTVAEAKGRAVDTASGDINARAVTSHIAEV